MATHTRTNLAGSIKTVRNLIVLLPQSKTEHHFFAGREHEGVCKDKMPLSKQIKRNFPDGLFLWAYDLGISTPSTIRSNPAFQVAVPVESLDILFGNQIDRRAGHSAEKNAGRVLA